LRRRAGPESSVNQPTVDRKGVLVLSFQAPLWYANSDLLRDKAVALLAMPKVHGLIIDMSAVSFMDTTAIDTLKDLKDAVTRRMVGKHIVFCSVNARVARMLADNQLVGSFSGNSQHREFVTDIGGVKNTQEADPVMLFADTVYEAVRRSNILWAAHKRHLASVRIRESSEQVGHYEVEP